MPTFRDRLIEALELLGYGTEETWRIAAGIDEVLEEEFRMRREAHRESEMTYWSKVVAVLDEMIAESKR